MISSMFRCPRSETYVAVPFSPDPAFDPNTYEYVAYTACGWSHLVNKSTGTLLGDRVNDVHSQLQNATTEPTATKKSPE